MITVTESAVKQLRGMAADQPADRPKALRLAVERGGCAGMQYEMGFEEPRPGDVPIRCDDVTVYLAAGSERFLQGSELDYEDGLSGAGFRLRNPNAVRSCGCGTSFEPSTPA